MIKAMVTRFPEQHQAMDYHTNNDRENVIRVLPLMRRRGWAVKEICMLRKKIRGAPRLSS